jgi:hypothetical protein
MNNSSLPAWRKFLANHKLNKLYDEDIAKLSCKELHEALESFAYIIYGKNVTDPLFNRHTQIIIEKLYHKSIEENYYWQFCSFKTYKNHLNKLPFEYFKKHKEDGRNLYSFYPYELNELKNYYDSEKKMFVYRFRKDGTALHLYFNATETDTFTFITNSLHEKIDLIENRLNIIENYPAIVNFTPFPEQELFVSQNQFCKGFIYSEPKDYKTLSNKVNSLSIGYNKILDKINSGTKKEKINAFNYLNMKYLSDLKGLLNDVVIFVANQKDVFFETKANLTPLADLLHFIDCFAKEHQKKWHFPTVETFIKNIDNIDFESSEQSKSEYLSDMLSIIKNQTKTGLKYNVEETLTIDLICLSDFPIYNKLKNQKEKLISYIESILQNEPEQTQPEKKPEIKLTAPAKDLFCKILIESGIEKVTEKNIMHTCTRICKKYNIELQSKLGKSYYHTHKTVVERKYLRQISELILPTIKDTKIESAVHEFTESK